VLLEIRDPALRGGVDFSAAEVFDDGDAAVVMAARPLFMSAAPRPYSSPSSITG